MFCPSCGKSVSESSSFCMYCGKPTGFTSDAPATQTSVHQVATSQGPTCPNCSQVDKAQKASMLVAAGTTTGTAPIAQVGQIGRFIISGTAYRETQASTVFAQRLAPPPEAERLQVALEHMGNPRLKEGLGAERLFRSSLFLMRWGLLYYCSRCDGVYIPSEGNFVAVARIRSLIYVKPEMQNENELCEIEVEKEQSSRWRFRACVLGAKGFYIARLIQWDDYHKGGPETNCRKCLKALEQILQELGATGWEQVDNEFGRWWQILMTRKASAA